MKKKLLVLVAMLLCVVTVLASCASTMKFKKIVGDGTYNDENPTLTTAAKVDVKGAYDSDLSKGDLAIFVDTNAETQLPTYTVYNLATGAVIYTVSDSKKTEGGVTTTVKHDFEVYPQWDTTWFKVAIETEIVTVVEGEEPKVEENYTVSLRDAKGAEFATATDIYSNTITDKLDLIIYNEKAYRIADDGTIAHAFDYSALRSVPYVDTKVGDYYYSVMVTGPDSNEIVYGIEVYNSNLELAAYYMRPSYVNSNADCVVAPLNNGNVLIQYTVLENDMAEDYTYVANGNKYTLYTFLLNVEKGKTKELDLDYVVQDVTPRDQKAEMTFEALGYNEEIENIAIVYPIEDGRVDMSHVAAKYVSLTNKGKVDGVLDGVIDNMLPGGIFQVATNRWIVMNLSYQLFLLNEKGEVLGEVTGAVDMEDMMMSESIKPYFILNDKIYDWDLAVKYDMHANEVDIVAELNHGILMENKDDELLLYANGEVKTLITKDDEDKDWSPLPIGLEWNEEENSFEPIFSGEGFVVMTEGDDTVKYEFYNDLGAVVLTLENVELDEDLFVCAADSTNAFMIKVTETVENEEKTVYYRFG